jgi:hypothetical protein
LSRHRSAPTCMSVHGPFCPLERGYKRAPSSCTLSAPCSLLSTSSKFTVALLYVHRRRSPRAEPLTAPPFLLAGPKASSCPGDAPRPLGASPSTLESRHVVAAPVSFCLDVTPLPQSVSKATTSLCRCATVRGGASMSTLQWICCWRAAPSRVVRAQHVRGRRDHGPPLRGVGRAKSGRSGSVTGPGQATCTVRVGRHRDFGPFSIKNRKSFFYFYSFSI